MGIREKMLTCLLAAVIALAAPACTTLGSAERTAADIEDTAASTEPLLKTGDYLLLGKYKDQPIIWRCVGTDENGPLIFSDRVLLITVFDLPGDDLSGSHGRFTSERKYGSNYWGDSNIRSWLNSSAEDGKVKWLCGNSPGYVDKKGFLADGNFTQTERNAIKEVIQKNLLHEYDAELAVTGTVEAWRLLDRKQPDRAASHYDDIIAEYVTDKVFLLDVPQVHMVDNNSDILGDCLGTRYAENWEGEKRFFDDYWLRTPDQNSSLRITGDTGSWVMQMSRTNDKMRINSQMAYLFSGIRPAFYLDEANAVILSGSGTEEDPYIMDGKKKQDILVYCNGWELSFDQPPTMESDRVLVPMRKIFEALGAEVSWNGDSQTVTATKGKTTITLQIGMQEMYKNGEMIWLDVPARIENDRTLVPLRAVSEGLGASVEWDGENSRVLIMQ